MRLRIAKMFLIKKNLFFRFDRPTILYVVNLWLIPISATAARMELPSVRLLLLLWGLSDPRIFELCERPRCFSITCKTQVYDRLGVIPL